MSVLPWVLLAALAVAGATAIVLALRGRRVDDHPICRRCRFDLVGVYPRAAACPECGADLAAHRAVRRGHRRGRRGLLAAAVVLLAPGLAGLAALAASAVAGVNLAPYKPTILLYYEARSADDDAARPALDELRRRLADGELDEATIAGLVEHALAAQADPNRPWLPARGNVLEDAWAAGHLTKQQRAAYARRAADLSLSIRDRVRQGSTVHIGLSGQMGRSGLGGSHIVVPRVLRSTLGETAVTPDLGGLEVPSVGGAVLTASTSMPIEVPPGEHTLTLELLVRSQIGQVTVDWPLTLSTPVEVVARDAVLVALVDEPAMAETVRSCIDAGHPSARRTADGQVAVRGRIVFKNPPVGLAFDVLWRAADGREWKVATATAPPGSGGFSREYNRNLDGFQGEMVDVVLRPNVAAAEATSGLTSIWGAQVVIPDVPVIWIDTD